jgi:peptidoglycan/LPS O-acetylase OafA/YrhL
MPSSTANGPAAAAPAERIALPSLTGLRFLAALAVFFFHSSLSNSPIPPNGPINPFADKHLADTIETTFSKCGYLGVSFFFVLSGFLLAWSSRPGRRTTAFWRRRLVKIFPNHLVVFAAAMVLFAGRAVHGVLDWLPNLFLLHTFFPQAHINLSVSPPTWSLGSELLFYLLFPLLILPVRRIAQRRLWWWAGVMVAGTIGVQLVTQYLIPDTPKSAITPVSDMQFWFGYLFPPGRLFEFVLGMLLARIVAAGRWPRVLGIRASVVLLAAGYGVALEVPFQYSFVVAMIVPIGALVSAVAAADRAGRRTALDGRVMVRLGEISFGFYLVQGVTIFYLRKQFLTGTHSVPVALAMDALFFTITLLGGWLLWRFVEMPAMRRFSRARRPAPAVVAGASVALPVNSSS